MVLTGARAGPRGGPGTGGRTAPGESVSSTAQVAPEEAQDLEISRSPVRRGLWCIAASLWLGLAGPATRADEAETWDAVDRATLSPSAAIASVDDLAAKLDAAGSGTRSGDVTAYTREESGRTPLAERVDAAVGRAKVALSAAGFTLGDFEGLSIISVRSTTGASGAVVSNSGKVVLVRERSTIIAATPLGLRKRTDGPSPRADMLVASDDALVSLAERIGRAGQAAGPGSLPNAVARALVRGVTLDPAPPAWLFEGLVGWIEGVAFPETMQAPLHACGGPKGPGVFLLAPKVRPTGAQARLLGLLVGQVMKGAKDGPDRVRGLTGDGAAKALETLLGRAPADVIGELAKRAKPDPVTCDAAGTVPCPVCRSGKVEMACDACASLGQVACPACDGDPRCFAPGCCDGLQFRRDGEPICSMCNGNTWLPCHVCADKGRFPCLVCSGSGRAIRTCLVCAGRGRVPCVEGGGAATTDAGPAACPWCGDPSVKAACATCAGSGFVGCRLCHGSNRVPCDECVGLGCAKCGKFGYELCPRGDPAKSKCTDCGGSGRRAPDPTRCRGCSATAKAPDAALAYERVGRRRGAIDAALRAKNVEMIQKAVAFLMTCRYSDGPFALRKQRWIPTGALGALQNPTLFSNSMALCALMASGVPRDLPAIAEAFQTLENRLRNVVNGSDDAPDVKVQSVSLSLRAMVSSGVAPDDVLVKGLVKRLADAQRPSGHWAGTLVSKEPGDAFHSLFAIEALYVAQRRGAKVPAETWARALSAGLKLSSTINRKMGRTGFLSGTDVASQTALIVMAKAGGLGSKAKDLDEYRTLPQVAQGLAWLDRFIEFQREPIVASGALVRGDGDGGYFSWIYSIERLGRLLSMPELGGRRWYVEGCRRLATLQQADGSFEELGTARMNGPLRCTSMALFFLTRATPPITSENSSADGTTDPDAEAEADGPR